MIRSILGYLGFRSAKRGMLSRIPGARAVAPLVPFVRVSSLLPIVGGYFLWRNRHKVKGYLGGMKEKHHGHDGEPARIGTNDVSHHSYP